MKHALIKAAAVLAVAALAIFIGGTKTGEVLRAMSHMIFESKSRITSEKVADHFVIIDLTGVLPGEKYRRVDPIALAQVLEKLPLELSGACYLDLDLSPEPNQALDANTRALLETAKRKGCFVGVDRSLGADRAAYLGDEKYADLAVAMHTIRPTGPEYIVTHGLYSLSFSNGVRLCGVPCAFAAKSAVRRPPIWVRPFADTIHSHSIPAELNSTVKEILISPIHPGVVEAMSNVTKPLPVFLTPGSPAPDLRGKFVFIALGIDQFVPAGVARPAVPGINLLAATVYGALFAPVYELTFLGHIVIEFLPAALLLLSGFVFASLRARGLVTADPDKLLPRVAVGIAAIFFVFFFQLAGIVGLRLDIAVLATVFAALHPQIEAAIEKMAFLAWWSLRRLFRLPVPAMLLLLLAAVAAMLGAERKSRDWIGQLTVIKGAAKLQPAHSPAFVSVYQQSPTRPLFPGDRVSCPDPCRAVIRYNGLNDETPVGAEFVTMPAKIQDLEPIVRRILIRTLLDRRGGARTLQLVRFPQPAATLYAGNIFFRWNATLAGDADRLLILDAAGNTLHQSKLDAATSSTRLDLAAHCVKSDTWTARFEGRNGFVVSRRFPVRCTLPNYLADASIGTATRIYNLLAEGLEVEALDLMEMLPSGHSPDPSELGVACQFILQGRGSVPDRCPSSLR